MDEKNTLEPSLGSVPGEDETFDGILRQLQAIVEKLESSGIPLEDSLRAFERGVALSRRGQAILDAAERRVELLLRDGKTEPLRPGPNEP